MVAFCETLLQVKPNAEPLGFHCVYDAWNRLVEVKVGATVVGVYEYDGVNRRTKKGMDDEAPGDPNGVDAYWHFYYSSGWQVLETRCTDDEDDAPDSANPVSQYVWSARYVDAPILWDWNTDQDNDCTEDPDERFYFYTDANNNVTALLTEDAVLEYYAYDPYGRLTVYDGGWSNPSSSSK